MDTPSRFITPGAVFALTLVTGVWLSRSGKPLSSAIFTIHKLIALAAVILTSLPLYSLLMSTGSRALAIVLIIVAALSVISLFATGALMSIRKSADRVLLSIHKVAPFLAAICVAAAAYLLAG